MTERLSLHCISILCSVSVLFTVSVLLQVKLNCRIWQNSGPCVFSAHPPYTALTHPGPAEHWTTADPSRENLGACGGAAAGENPGPVCAGAFCSRQSQELLFCRPQKLSQLLQQGQRAVDGDFLSLHIVSAPDLSQEHQ